MYAVQRNDALLVVLSLQIAWTHTTSSTKLSQSAQLQVQKEGTDVTLVGYGKMVGYNLDAAEELQKEGISCEVSSSAC